MAVTPLNINKLRRLRVLQRLAQVMPEPMGERALLASLRADVELSPTTERIRKSLRYLAVDGRGLVTLITMSDTDWLAAAITPAGIDWLADPGDAGFAIYSPGEHPPKSHKTQRGRVSSVTTLPPEVKAWLDQEIVARQFSQYSELAELLASRGYEISRSAIGRYGKGFKAEQKQLRQSIEMAKAFAETIGDDGAAMNQTLTALAQQEIMAVIRDKKFDAEDVKLPALIQSIAQLNRQNIATLKFQIEQAARNKAIDDAANAIEAAAQQKGLSKKDAQFWREQVLGVK